ncbi:MAG: GNAT family N-acetyltransferase [Solirubrobacterales bacterium]
MTLIAAADDAGLAAAGRLLDRFNREYDDPSPGPEWLADRLRALIGAGRTDVLLAGDGPDGILVFRYLEGIWSDGDVAYVAEYYVVPERRRLGLGAALLEATLARCRERGCDHVFLHTDEGDRDAHRLYERFGFSNLTGPFPPARNRERMYVYERAL